MEHCEGQLEDFCQRLRMVQKLVMPVMEKYSNENKDFRLSMERIAEVFNERLKQFQPEIMFFGIYNAGKSSILNALMGEDCAKVADVPTTDSIDFYNWHGYRLADTPGVNAPIAHQRVTEEHLRKSDVVIFVMSTNGGFEDIHNYEQMKSIIEHNKQLLIVLNDKFGYDMNNLAQAEIVREIKNKIAINMMQLGAVHSISEIENKYDIIMVHAKRALNGRKQKCEEMVAASNINALETAILCELQRTDGFKILITVVDYLKEELEPFLLYLTTKVEEADNDYLVKMVAATREQKNLVACTMNSSILGMANGLEAKLMKEIWDNRQDDSRIETAVENVLIQFSQDVQARLASQLVQSQQVLQRKVEADLARIDLKFSGKRGAVGGSLANDDAIQIDDLTGATPKTAVDTLENFMRIIETFSPIVYAKELVIPSTPAGQMGKLVGEAVAKKAMDLAVKAGSKQLAKVIGVAVPYIGPIIVVGSLLYDLVRWNDRKEEEAYARKCARAEAENEQERQRVAREIQAKQELRQNCKDMVYDLTNSMIQAVEEQISGVFQKMEESFENELKETNEQMTALMNDVNAVQEGIASCNSLKMKLVGIHG